MSKPVVLSIIPPLVQVNTPYPATSFLTGFLKSIGYPAFQEDLGLKWVLKILSTQGLRELRSSVLQGIEKDPSLRTHDGISFFLQASDDYIRTIDPVIRFLQGKDPTLAHRIAARTLLPEGPRFQALEQEDLAWAFGVMGVQDQAKHLASLYIDDLADVIQAGVEPEFSLSRYGEKLAASSATFDPLLKALRRENTFLDHFLTEVTLQVLNRVQPSVVLITIPFPGCVLGSLKIARVIREWNPQVRIAVGGGYVNTELRTLRDARFFDFFDAMTLDDGERPLECLLSYWEAHRGRDQLLRTYLRSERVSGAFEYCTNESIHDYPQTMTGYPTVEGLPISDYLSMVEMLNPMHRYWSDLHWNKIMLAHGCYWHQCSFCDVSLDYIKRYEISPANLTIERMDRLFQESGSSGFHLVDEAAPPALLKELSKGLIAKQRSYTWWGNIRFERAFTPEVTALMADAGCVAVSGGLEVASDRLLKVMKKGVTVAQVARVTHAFRRAGVMVHAYLMYGFPTQTEQETIDSLERVRQLFMAGCLNSAFWHRFSATAHSPVGLDPERYGVLLRDVPDPEFARNDLSFSDPSGVDHDRYSFGLKKAVYNYMLGIGLDADVRTWFSFKAPKPQVDPRLIEKALKGHE